MDCSVAYRNLVAEEHLQFLVVGLIASSEFQKCRWLVEKLHSYYPKKFDKPQIRGMLDLDWDIYLTKMRRRHGREFWILQKPVVVFLNGDFLGDDRDLDRYISKDYIFESDVDFEEISNNELIAYFSNYMDKYKRQFVYLMIAIEQKVIGSMVFMLYSDLVPKTCQNFLRRCKRKSKSSGYCGTRIHRHANTSWIQCGGWKLRHKYMPCENYVIGHDKRGVLSMCNQKRHVDNSTQFLITLEATPWMDYRYVAFGQLIQGANILRDIENVPTFYQSSVSRIEIVDCGVFSLCPAMPKKFSECLLRPSKEKMTEFDIDSSKSDMSSGLYGIRKYHLETDLQSYLPLSLIPGRFWQYLQQISESTNESALEEGEGSHHSLRQWLKTAH